MCKHADLKTSTYNTLVRGDRPAGRPWSDIGVWLVDCECCKSTLAVEYPVSKVDERVVIESYNPPVEDICISIEEICGGLPFVGY